MKKKGTKKKKAAPKKKKSGAKKEGCQKNGKKKSAPKTKAQKSVGVVTHFYTQIKVAIVKFKTKVSVGTKLQYKGATTDFEEEVKSMQFDHKEIKVAPKGKQIGIKVKKRVRDGDAVYIVK
jgi:hypothetical protein